MANFQYLGICTNHSFTLKNAVAAAGNPNTYIPSSKAADLNYVEDYYY
jgi:hypothetical protein